MIRTNIFSQHRRPSPQERQRSVGPILLLVLVLLQYVSGDPFSLRLDDNHEPFCKGGVELLSLKVSCEGTDGACDFGTNMRLKGSIVPRQTLSRSATVDAVAFIDGLTVRHLSHSSNVDLCNYVNSTGAGDGGSSCSSGDSIGRAYFFDISYNITYMEDPNGWWFQYNNKFGVDVDLTDTATDGTDFSAVCRMVFVVKHVYDVYGNFAFSAQYYRILYWGCFGFATMTSGFWIGYSVRRKCRVMCIDDLNRIVGVDDEHDTGMILEMKPQQPQPRLQPTNDLEESVKYEPSAEFQIMTDSPPLASVECTVTHVNGFS